MEHQAVTTPEAASAQSIPRRRVIIDIELGNDSMEMDPKDLDMDDGESVEAFIARQVKERQSPYSLAQDLDLIGGDVTLTFYVMETGADGKQSCVDRGEWPSRG